MRPASQISWSYTNRRVHALKRNLSTKAWFALILSPIFNVTEVNSTQVIHNSDIYSMKQLAVFPHPTSDHAKHSSPHRTILIRRPILHLTSRTSGIACGLPHPWVILSRLITITGDTSNLITLIHHLSLAQAIARFNPTMNILPVEEIFQRWSMWHRRGDATVTRRRPLLLTCHRTLRKQYESDRTVNCKTFSRISPTAVSHLHYVPIRR